VLWTLPGLVGCGSDSEGQSSETTTSSDRNDASTTLDDADDGETPIGNEGPSQTGNIDGNDPAAPGTMVGDAAVSNSPQPSDTLDGGTPSSPVAPLPSDEATPGFVEIGTNPDGTIEILCGNEPCACSDGMDNDGDGVADGADSECTGPFDHDESTFATGIPGDNRDPKWQDCFFDGNSGAGDDGCRYHSDCLTGDLPEDDRDCQVTESCREYCQPLTPPGCDCFGCCDVTTDDGETLHILVGESCSLANIDDEKACPRCEPTTICANECGECEICVGMTVDDLPDSCWPETDPPTGAGGGPSDGAGGSDSTGAGGGPSSGSGGAPGSGGSTSGAGGSTNPPDEPGPPPNSCDGDLTACFDSGDCSATEYCSLGCCKPTFQVR
jgi:hypothetical protein